MSYPQWRGQDNKVHNTGQTAYGGDGTDMHPLLVDADGRLDTKTRGVYVEVTTTKALEAAAGYTANDVLSETDTASAGTAWTFSTCARANGAGGYITKATAISESESVTPRLTLYVFHTTPANGELDDNAANISPDAGDKAKYVGKIDFPALESLGTTDSTATVTPSTVGGLPLGFTCAAADDDLYGILVTRDAFTQTATDDMTIILGIEQY